MPPLIETDSQPLGQTANMSTGDNIDMPLWTALYDYQAQGEDELSLKCGIVVYVLSKDSNISGDEGWWTGKIGDKVGIFPSNFVTEHDPMLLNVPSDIIGDIQPVEIDYNELELKEVIGVGGKIVLSLFLVVKHSLKPNVDLKSNCLARLHKKLVLSLTHTANEIFSEI